MGLFSNLPAWAQWTAFAMIAGAAAFGLFFTVFVTWPFFRESMRTMKESHSVNRRLLALIQKAEKAEEAGEFSSFWRDLRKWLKSGGGLAGKL